MLTKAQLLEISDLLEQLFWDTKDDEIEQRALKMQGVVDEIIDDMEEGNEEAKKSNRKL